MRRPKGAGAFAAIWGGQFVSLLGSSMTGFALSIWAWNFTGRATSLSMVAFFWVAPVVFLGPISGVLVDRWNRKTVLILSDLAAGVATIAILILHLTGHLQLWHLFAAALFEGAFHSFQYPAYSASITLLIPKKHYQRASGLVGMVGYGAGIIAPALTGFLLPVVDFEGVFAVDIVTFLVAIGMLLWVEIPQPERVPEPAGGPSFREELLEGFRFLRGRGFTGLLVVTSCVNFLMEFFVALVSPSVLARTDSSEIALGTVMSSFGVGGVAGGGVLALWGGPKRKIHGLLLGGMLTMVAGAGALGFGQNVFIWAGGAFLATFFFQFAVGGSHAIWQAKVPPAMQGRVFANRRMFGSMGEPLAKLMAGPLADYVFEPLMQTGQPGAHLFGWLVGTGSGAGMGLLIGITAVLSVLVIGVAYFIPSIRDIEIRVPDHDEIPADPSAEMGTKSS